MTSAPADPTPDGPRRFLRSRDDRVLGGVAGGLGRAFGVDAVIFRIALAALVFAGGVGLLVYGAALLVVPADDGTGHPLPREGTWRAAAALGGGLLLLGAAAVVVGQSGFWAGGWLVPAGLVVLVGWLVMRHRERSGDERPPGAERTAGGTLRRVAVLGLIGLVALTGAGVAFWGSAWATAAGAGVAVAGVVLALGVALVVAAFRGDRRARWLAVPAIVIAFPAAVVSAADISLDGGVGERSYRPTGADPLPGRYRLGAGELKVDLRGLDWSAGQRRALRLDVGVGHAVVLVPASVCVGARSDIRAGYADVLGRDAGGVDVVHDVARAPAAGAPGLTLDVHVGMGAFEVLHQESEEPRDLDPDVADDPARVAARAAGDRACAGGRS